MKKKLLSLLLAATLVFSMFSFTAFAEEATRTEQWFEKHHNEFHMKFLSINLDGEKYTYEVYLKNNKSLMENVPFSDGIYVNLLFDGEKYFLYPTKFPFIHFELPVEEEYVPDDDLLSGIEELYYLGSYTETIDSKEYYIEKFTDDEYYCAYSTLFEFYFEGDELKMIVADKDYDMRAEIISTEIDDSEFEPPFFSINLTPFFEFLLRLFSFADLVI